MPVLTVTNKCSYSCDGSLQVFTFSFPINVESEIQVRIRDAAGDETLKTLTTDYTLTKASDSWDDGGYVTTVATYAAGNEIHIRRVVTADQQTDYVENNPFPAESHEAAIDKLTMLYQQLDEMIERAILLKATTGYSDLYIPDPVANRFLAWRADLAGLKNVEAVTATGTYTITAFAKTLFDDVDAAAFLTTLGFSAFVQTILNDADAAAVLTTLGVSAFIQTLLNDADAETACDTIGALDVINDTLDDVPNGASFEKVAAAFVDANGKIEKILTTCQFESAVTRTISAAFTGYVTAGASAPGDKVAFDASQATATARIALNFPNGAIVTEMRTRCGIDGDATIQIKLKRWTNAGAVGSDMAETNHVDGEQTDNTIANATIDNATYHYTIEAAYTKNTSVAESNWIQAEIDYTILEPKP